ncbi:MAG: hypothetical protein GF398_17825 [Chitinivibrionales bacterium]|nr:hypothetical protein [Chitinivibrionales bacterium]
MAEHIPFSGTGWSFPPTFIKSRASVETITDEDEIRSSLEVLLSTAPGERILQPDFGCDLRPLLFEPLDTSLKTYIKDRIRVSILYHEPRIRLDDVNLVTVPDEGKIEILIDYTIRATNSRHNMVYPFYLEEGVA